VPKPRKLLGILMTVVPVVLFEGGIILLATFPVTTTNQLLSLVVLAVCGLGLLLSGAMWVLLVRDLRDRLQSLLLRVQVLGAATCLTLGVNLILYSGIRAYISL
jgi:hypothetical protein